MSLDKYRIAKALDSYASLREMLPSLTYDEIVGCLSLEAGSQRRATVLRRLIFRASAIKAQEHRAELNKKFLGK